MPASIQSLPNCAGDTGTHSIATQHLWDALRSGHVAGVSAALNADADANALDGGHRALDSLDAFGANEAVLVTMMLLINGATVESVDEGLESRVAAGLRKLGFQCGAKGKRQLVGMHMLPPALFDVYRRTAASATGLSYPMRTFKTEGTGRTLRGNLWRAIGKGDHDGVLMALLKGANPLSKSTTSGKAPLDSLDAFERVGAAMATLYLVIFGAPVDTSDAQLMSRIDLALLITGFGCGACVTEAAVGMHSLPDALHPLYLAAVASADRVEAEIKSQETPPAKRSATTRPSRKPKAAASAAA